MEYEIMHYENPEELYHYGVKGMKWGVRRATKQLTNASDSASRNKAVAKLEKHRTKGTAKVKKLEKQHVELKKKVERNIVKSDTKAAKLSRQAAATRMKAYGRFVSKDKSADLIFKANKLDAKANDLKARSEASKAKLAKNEKMTEMFNREIKNIDRVLEDKGRRYIEGK